LKIFLLSGPFEEIDVFYFFEIFLFFLLKKVLKKRKVQKPKNMKE
jgi:hypothetical protein